MFDWDDQELANIIWGEEGKEAEDHIVPYPVNIEKELLSNYGDNHQKTLIREDSKSEVAETNTSTSKLLDGSKREKNDGVSVPGAVDSQLEMPSFSASKPNDGGIGKKSQLDIGPEASRNHHEDKELGDLVGNSWVSIGSFDDLDRIFSNDDLDGKTSLGSTDELWSSPKDLLSGPAKSSSPAIVSTHWDFGALGITPPNIEINSEYLHNEDPSIAAGHETADSRSPYLREMIGRNVEQEEYAVDTAGLFEDKIGLGITEKMANTSHIVDENIASSRKSTNKEQWSKTKLKQEQATDRRNDSRLLWDIYDSWPSSTLNVPQFGHECVPSLVQSYPTSFPGQQFSGQPSKMTPQEKIEKLRRRHKMRAMLAIQKQEQRLGHQVSTGEFPSSHKTCHEDQVQHMEKSDLDADEILSILPCYDPGSPNKGDDSSKISCIDDHSVEDTVLYQLQDIISRLDMKIRLCIRDSLYRLAQSATQRHYANETSGSCGTKRSGTYEHDIATEERSSHERFVGNSNSETETNHIDRAVAHLLFHRPLKLSVRLVETPESSASTKVSTEQETATTPRSLQVGLLPKSSENDYNRSTHDSTSPLAFTDSQKEDVTRDITRKEMRIIPQTKEMTTECAE